LASRYLNPLPVFLAGKEVDPLVAAGSIELAGADVAVRLAAGERVMVPLQLAEPAAGKQQQLPGGLGGQVRLQVYAVWLQEHTGVIAC
jgi:hypothetical protein